MSLAAAAAPPHQALDEGGGTSTDYARLEEDDPLRRKPTGMAAAAAAAVVDVDGADEEGSDSEEEEEEEVLFTSPTSRRNNVMTAGLPKTPKSNGSSGSGSSHGRIGGMLSACLPSPVAAAEPASSESVPTTPTTPATPASSSSSHSSNDGAASPSHQHQHRRPSAMALLSGLGVSLSSSGPSSSSSTSMSRMRTASSQEHAAAAAAAAEGHLSISGGRGGSPAATPRFHHHVPKWFQVSYFLLVVGAFVYFLVDSFTSKKLFHMLERLFEWIEQHFVLGPLAFCACVIVFSLLCVPESALTVGGGYIFAQAHGVVGGIVLCASLVVAGGITGALISFLIARYLCFDTVQRWSHRYRLLRAIDRSLVENGLKMVFLLRLSPFLPFNVLNYLMGVTSVTLRDFLLGSFGMLPWVCTCAYIGSALKGVKDVAGAARGGAAHQHKALSYTAYALGAAGTMGVVWLISQYTRRAFAEVLREDVEVGTGAVVGVAGAGGYAEMGAAGAGGGSGGQEGEEEEKEEVFEVEDDRIRGVVADMERGARREAV